MALEPILVSPIPKPTRVWIEFTRIGRQTRPNDEMETDGPVSACELTNLFANRRKQFECVEVLRVARSDGRPGRDGHSHDPVAGGKDPMGCVEHRTIEVHLPQIEEVAAAASEPTIASEMAGRWHHQHNPDRLVRASLRGAGICHPNHQELRRDTKSKRAASPHPHARLDRLQTVNLTSTALEAIHSRVR